MKTSAIKPLLLSFLGLAIGTLLPSCVDPYVADYGSPHRVSSYHPGYEVRDLPAGYRIEMIEGTRYYNHNGTYYQSRSGGYVIVETPRFRYQSDSSRYESSYSRHVCPDDRREVIITRLPNGYRVVNHSSGRDYQYNGVYYQQRGSGYVIVSRPY